MTIDEAILQLKDLQADCKQYIDPEEPDDVNDVHAQDVEAIDVVLKSIPRWIPCGERLPRCGEKILVQYADGDIRVIDDAGPQLWSQLRSIHARVQAWMPLPEPYGGGGDEG